MNIYQRINEVRKDVRYIQKDAQVQNYRAVTHDNVTARLRESMIKNGIVVVPTLNTYDNETITTRKGTLMVRHTATYSVSFVNMDDPKDVAVVAAVAMADDAGDKAPGKALSLAVKNSMLKVFSLETGENDTSRVEFERVISAEEVAGIQALADEAEADMPKLLAYLKVTSLNDLTAAGSITAINSLKAKIKRNEK